MKTMMTMLNALLVVALLAPLVVAMCKVQGAAPKGIRATRRALGLRGGVVVYNSAGKKEPMLFAPALEVAINADALPEWIQLAPYGEHKTRDKKRTQVFNAESAAQVVSWFDFWPRKIGRLMGINACPIWVGHPDFDSATWPERRQLGSVQELEAREDGLWGRVSWNAEADKALRDEGHKWPSVAWDCDEINAEQIQPVMLWSVGMWHKPNIKTVAAVINAEGEDMEEDEDKAERSEGMLGKIMTALREAGILRDGDSEDAVLGQIGSMIQSLAWRREEEKRSKERAMEIRTALNAGEDVADEALATEAITQLNAARERIAVINAARTELILTRLMEAGRVTGAEREQVAAQLNAAPDEESLQELVTKLATIKPQLNATAISLQKAKATVATARERATQLNAWIEAAMSRDGISYDQAWERSRTHEDTKHLHEAMAQADGERTSRD